MSDPSPRSPDPWRSPFESVGDRLTRRRQRIAEEIARNRRGEYTVPTWVLGVALVAIVITWTALIIFS